MFESCHTPAEVATVYHRLGFTGISCAFGRVSLLASPRLGAVVVPGSLARGVRDLLTDNRRGKPVVVLGYARAGRPWVFLVGPQSGKGHSATTLARLADQGIRVLIAGQRIWLPMSDNRTSSWYWICPPSDLASLPARITVLSAVTGHLDALRARSAGV